MAVLGRENMHKARRIQAKYAQERKEANEKRIEEQKRTEPISEEEHNKRVEMLKSMGLLKG
ncbi:MAG: hypothetical protein Q7R87_01580 [Nanoarchaeota archaeon]|nr:hypothetical protein [Nanoarchaeota archaeon]